MSKVPSVLAAIQAPTIEVRDHMGELVGRIQRADVGEIVERGWAKPVGRRQLKYLRLTEGAPWKPLAKNCHGGSRTTQRVRADGSSGLYEPGQLLGWEKNLEHKRPYD
jgi:hypothetical protein